jgi:hypothetical protein
MASNPLQQYFRQPKIYINLPSKGIFMPQGSVTGDTTNMPVYGMTGMDEIMMKTPDALLTGTSTVKVIESCCPNIKDAWQISNIDIDCLLAAIRIATYGNTMDVSHSCSKCNTDNTYPIDITGILEHFTRAQYDNEIVFGDFKIYIKPLNYQLSSEFAQRNFALSQQMNQLSAVKDEEERTASTNKLFAQLAQLQNEIFVEGIDSVEIKGASVTEHAYIKEWLQNADVIIFDQIKKQISKNQDAWLTPEYELICENCRHTDQVRVGLDQSNFFANA